MEWERVDGELPQNARVTGTLLTIYQVQPQDMGIYRCRASDRGQTVYVQVALEIQCEYESYKVYIQRCSHEYLLPKVLIQ